MRPLISGLLLSVLVFAGSCRKKYYKVDGEEYFIIGWSGTIAGITKYYIITNDRVIEDTTLQRRPVPEAVGGFRFDYPLPDSCFKQVANLKNEIPSELFSKNNQFFGKNTIADGVSKEVRIKVNGMQYRWFFNNDLSDCSPAIQAFSDKLPMF